MKTKRFLSLVLLSAVVVSCLGISTEAAEYQGEVITYAVDEAIEVTQRGNYVLAVRNNSSQTIHVSGHVNY